MHKCSLFQQNVFMVQSFNKDDCSELFTLVILEFILHMNKQHPFPTWKPSVLKLPLEGLSGWALAGC